MSLRKVLALSAVLVLYAAGSSWAAPPHLGVLPQGKAGQAQTIVQNTCSACHGTDGNSISSTFPNLAGQNYNYLLKELEDFNSGARKASTMQGIVQTLPQGQRNRDFENLATYFSTQKLNRKANANGRTEPSPAKALTAGYDIYTRGIRNRHVPACSACHLPTGLGMAPMAIPSLAGQHAQYVETQLKHFASGARNNSPHHIMGLIAKRLGAEQIKDVALYVQSLHPDLLLGVGPRTYKAYTKPHPAEPIPGIPVSAVAPATTPTTANDGKTSAQHRTASNASN